jgi:hypothetical protein
VSESKSLGMLKGSWRAGGLLSLVIVIGATLGFSQVSGASPPAGGHGAFGGHPGLIYTNRVVGFPQHELTPPATLQAKFGFSRPRITSQPSNATVAPNATASFSASASGSPAPTVQWQVSTNGKAWSNASGASSMSPTYSFTAVPAESGSRYRAVFSNLFGNATTNAATLTVTGGSTPPTITSQPSGQTVASNTTASFSAAASGSPTPTVQWEVSTDGGTTWSNTSGTSSTSTTYSFTAQTSQNEYEYKAVFTNASGSATTNAATLTVSAAPLDQSSNWSGYADMGSGFSAVNGNWTVPTLSCTSSTSYSSHWIGIDGASSSTVEQDGTEADCSAGVASYDAWFEMYGDNAVNNGSEVELAPSSYPIYPADVMTASVSVANDVWTLAISDAGSAAHSHIWQYSTNITFSGAAQSSAEWVVERPEICYIFGCSLTTLANFGSVTFTNASATDNGSVGPISAASYVGIEMVNGSTPIAVPGSLDPTGTIFTDTYQ